DRRARGELVVLDVEREVDVLRDVDELGVELARAEELRLVAAERQREPADRRAAVVADRALLERRAQLELGGQLVDAGVELAPLAGDTGPEGRRLPLRRQRDRLTYPERHPLEAVNLRGQRGDLHAVDAGLVDVHVGGVVLV